MAEIEAKKRDKAIVITSLAKNSANIRSNWPKKQANIHGNWPIFLANLIDNQEYLPVFFVKNSLIVYKSWAGELQKSCHLILARTSSALVSGLTLRMMS